jgi:hypothetical protein
VLKEVIASADDDFYRMMKEKLGDIAVAAHLAGIPL